MFGSATRRRGPPVLHRRAAPRRPRAADALRRRRARATASSTASSGRSRPTPRPTCSARSTSSPTLYGAEGAQLQRDVDNYVAGVNPYIAEAKLDPTKHARRVRGDRPARRARTLEARPTSSPPPRWSAGSSARAAAASCQQAQLLAGASASASARDAGPRAVARLPRRRRPRGARRPCTARALPLPGAARRRSPPGSVALPDPRLASSRAPVVESELGRAAARTGARERRPAAAPAAAARRMSNALLVSRPKSSRPATRSPCSARRSATSRRRS